MRTLIYVPVIHTSADLGSLAKDVTKRGIAELGSEVWQEHRRIVEGFWDTITHYFNYIDGWRLKIYQDGMIAENEIGRRIVDEAVKQGSRNHELISNLLKRGATLVKTEDFNLVKEERDRLLIITRSRSMPEKLFSFMKYKFTKNSLLKRRDKFIAQRINETLNDGEKGTLFIGAFHNVKRWLAGDIQIKEIKDTRKIKDYYTLLSYYPRHKERFEELSQYLISKVEG